MIVPVDPIEDLSPSVLAPHFINTRYFREAAIAFKKNKGRYTLAPIGSKEWYEWWEEQEKRCLNGYKVGGVKVTGRHYFYMNFTQLRALAEEDHGATVGHKDWEFPSFYEIDYDWFWYKEIAWHGCTKQQLKRLHLWREPLDLQGGLHLGCLKTRRAGFSFKEAADGVYNYNFIDGSKSYYFAAIDDYLTDDGILNKVQYDLEFLNLNTDGFWKKNRMEHKTLMHQKASYKDRKGNTKGTLSEIIGTIITKPSKARGKDAMKIVFEEGGSFPNLKKALKVSRPSCYEGATMTGQQSVFGTGGDEKGEYMEGLEDVFDNPRSNKMLAFANDWEEGYAASECGVFIPTYMANRSFMDSEGNVDKPAAISWENKERELVKTGKDTREYDNHIAENPLYPKEALLRVSRNEFPKAAILEQKKRVLLSKEIQGLLRYGNLINIPGKGLTFVQEEKEKARPVDYYPHRDEDFLEGCIVMVEEPQIAPISIGTSASGISSSVLKVPDDVYLVVVDPYYKDDPKKKISLYSIKVIKRTSKYFNDKTDRCVAWYTGRKNKVEDCHQIALDLADFYNATIQSEIAGGGKGLFDHAKVAKKLSRLEFEPVLINNKELELTSANRSYFMTVGADNKSQGVTYFADWLKKCVGLDEFGNEIWNLHYIYDVGDLEELLKFNDSDNFDRISAWIVAMYMLKEKRLIEAKKTNKKPKDSIVGSRPLFANPDEDFSDRPFIMSSDLI